LPGGDNGGRRWGFWGGWAFFAPRAAAFAGPSVHTLGGPDDPGGRGTGPVAGPLPGLPAPAGPAATARPVGPQTPPAGPGPAAAPEGLPGPGAVPRPDRGRAGRLAAPHPRQLPDGRPAQVRPGRPRRRPGAGGGAVLGSAGGVAGVGPVVAQPAGHAP